LQSTSESSCYHCGLPLPAKPLYALLDGVQRPVCCTGCQAVALAIAGEGLSGYYRTRTEFAKRGDVAHAEDGLEVYDDPQLQAGFTRSTGEHEREALLILEGIVCSACIWLNEQHLSRLPGVLEAQVNYATRRARVRWDSRVVKLSAILRAVGEIGYRAWPATSMAVDEARRRETRTAIWRLFVAGFSMMQVMMYALPAYLPDADTMGDDLRMLMRLASLALTLPVLMYSCTPFWRGAWRDMQRMRPGMDVPIALGIGVAFVASVWATFTGGADVYYDSISMFVFFLLSARFLEMRARQKAAANLEHLDKALPAVAHRLPAFPDLRAEEVPALALRRGDLVLVRPGESFPVDGVVVQGESACDESLLTGESRPVSRSVGGEVIAGAFNRASPLVVRVERIAEDTRASGIRRLVERAASQRPALVELTDRIAGWLVSAVVLAALGTFAFWVHRDPAHAVWIAVSVLVVTCPCALSLATPAALTVGVGRLARRGVIVTRAQAIEALSKVTHVVFDKTGTLTEGRLSLVRSVPLSERSSEPCRAIAAALERGSEHPIAAALIASSDESAEPMVWQLRNVPGAGIEGVVDGARTRIGTSAFVAALTGTAPPETQHSSEAYTQVWLGREGEWLACFEFSDRLRSEAPEIVRNLRADGRQVMILSGDGEPAVREAAARLNIAQYEAGLTPEAKHARVQALQEQGAVVAMVGDGVNDAPVLAQAHVSIAMGSGALLSQAHSDIVLLSGLGSMLDAFRIARSTWRVVRQNLAWALAYNLVAIPAAAAGWVSPWLAGLGMGASSLVVVVNALRLLREEAREQVPDAAAAVPPASALRAM
jgi:Cu2+-exporting ATPase